MSLEKREKLSVVYVSIFIALLFHIPIIFSFSSNSDFYKNPFYNLTLIEITYQFFFHILLSCIIGFILLRNVQKVFSYDLFNIKMILIIILFTTVFWYIGSKSQELIFSNVSNREIFYRRALI